MYKCNVLKITPWRASWHFISLISTSFQLFAIATVYSSILNSFVSLEQLRNLYRKQQQNNYNQIIHTALHGRCTSPWRCGFLIPQPAETTENGMAITSLSFAAAIFALVLVKFSISLHSGTRPQNNTCAHILIFHLPSSISWSWN